MAVVVVVETGFSLAVFLPVGRGDPSALIALGRKVFRDAMKGQQGPGLAVGQKPSPRGLGGSQRDAQN